MRPPSARVYPSDRIGPGDSDTRFGDAFGLSVFAQRGGALKWLYTSTRNVPVCESSTELIKNESRRHLFPAYLQCVSLVS